MEEIDCSCAEGKTHKIFRVSIRNWVAVVSLLFILGMPRTEAQILYQKRQATWFRVCSASHSQFCNCGDWINHLKKYLWPLDTTGNTVSPPIREEVIDHFIIAGGGDILIGGESIGGKEDHTKSSDKE